MRGVVINYIGQLRVYSLIDLIILAFAANSNRYEFTGVILLHLSFLAYLENKHSHSYRNRISSIVWIGLAILGILFYGHFESVLFLACSYLYTLKTRQPFGLFSPLVRGLQSLFLVGGITGYHHVLPWTALVVLSMRNFAGDLRDVLKDKREKLKTAPIAMGFNKDIKYLHLFTLFLSSSVWWMHTLFPIEGLFFVFLIQTFTYNLTPR